MPVNVNIVLVKLFVIISTIFSASETLFIEIPPCLNFLCRVLLKLGVPPEIEIESKFACILPLNWKPHALIIKISTKIDNSFCYLSGEDGTALAYLAQGGHGCISVTANIAPKLCAELHINWKKRNIEEALRINYLLAKIHHSLFVESSPGPVKYGAELLNLCKAETRLPLVEIKDSTKNLVKNCMKEINLI